jgi:hypothetical protein
MMADDFDRATRQGETWSNADDPAADRLASYPEAGELDSPQTSHELVGQEPEPTPSGPQPAGADADLMMVGGPGDRLGGPHATDREGDPGLPGHDQPAEGGRSQASDDGRDGSLVDRLGR